MSTYRVPLLTEAEYLERERKAEFKSEYYAGEVYAMAGASLRHALLIANLCFQLDSALRAKGCLVVTNNLRVKVRGFYTYPDLVVVRGKPKLADSHQDILLNPIILIEVASPSTKDYDRGFKWERYREIESLQHYITVAQDKVLVERHQRTESGKWIFEEYRELSSTLALENPEIAIPIADIYADVDFTAPSTEPADHPHPN
jgi:Uma2 family endonuclease